MPIGGLFWAIQLANALAIPLAALLAAPLAALLVTPLAIQLANAFFRPSPLEMAAAKENFKANQAKIS